MSTDGAWMAAGFPDSAPGFPPVPRPGIALPAVLTIVSLAAMPTGVFALAHFSKLQQRGVAAAGLVMALAGFVAFLFWVNRVRNRWAWRVGRIVPARVLTARFADAGAIAMKVGLKSLGLGALGGAVNDKSTPVSVQYLEFGHILYSPVRSEGATRHWRTGDIVWVILHHGVLPLTLCAPAAYRNYPVPEQLANELEANIHQQTPAAG
jgi:hypothetical protein